MRLQELGPAVRRARSERGLTQAKLAAAAGLSRTTLNLLENGLVSDLGVKKLLSVLDRVGLELSLQPSPRTRRPDFVGMACTAASVSYKTPLTEDELIRTLLSGKPARGKRPHLRALLDEAAPALLRGLVQEASRWTSPGRLQRNLASIAREVGATRKMDEWLKSG